jgi:ABC-type transport system involved in multi-copper enzyme maturation permease subunit
MDRRISMRKTKVFAAATAALILAGIAGWASSTINGGQAAAAAPITVQIDTFDTMVKAKDLPTSHYDDYALVFPALTQLP